MTIEKTTENLSICQICNKHFKNKAVVSNHIKAHNMKVQEYYDRYYKTSDEGLCKICKSPTTFVGILIIHRNKGLSYNIYCSKYCQNNDEELNKQTNEIRENTTFKRYGYTNPFRAKDIQNKIEENNFKKYGKRFLLQSNTILEKIKQTNIKKYGHEIGFSSKIIQDKVKQTNLDRYGVTVPCHNAKILEKCHKNAHKYKKYELPSGKIISLQGYEPQFLDYIFKNNIFKEEELILGVKQVPKIEYYDKQNKKHYYFPDFLVPKWNLIIEIKSQWTIDNDWKWSFKEAETRKHFNLLIIKDNKFEELLKIVENFNK